jgi:hypothetical protein
MIKNNMANLVYGRTLYTATCDGPRNELVRDQNNDIVTNLAYA